MERQVTGFQSLSGNCRKKFRAHGITSVRSRSGIQAEAVRHFLEFQHTAHDIVTILRLRTEHLQKSPRIHRRLGLAFEGITAIADISHRRYAPVPQCLHPEFNVRFLLLHRRSVAHFIDLVDESRHAGSFPELLVQVGQFHVTMRVHESRYDSAVVVLRFGVLVGKDSGTQDIAVLINLHKAIFHRL